MRDLLRTKLFPPPPRTNQVTRKSLLDKFTQAWRNGVPCALVSTPAGFGKTTLVVDCARANERAFAWLALDEGDNDLLHFWRYVDAALESVDSHIGEGLRPALYAAQTPSIQQIITGLVNDIINPLIAMLISTGDLRLKSAAIGKSAILWGDLVATTIDFIIIALVVYFGVHIMGLDRLDHKDE